MLHQGFLRQPLRHRLGHPARFIVGEFGAAYLVGHGATIGIYIISPPCSGVGVEFREYTGLAVRIRLLPSCTFLPGLGHILRGMLVGNACDSAHWVHVVGGFNSPDLVRDLGDDIIGTPCEHSVDHAHSMILILVLGRTIRSSIIQTSGSIDRPNPMTIITAVVSWCEGVYPVPN